MTPDEIRALPALIPLDAANKALSLKRSTGYRLAQTGRYPVAVKRVGNGYRVATHDVIAFIGLEADPKPA
ncbi:hypothetical protein SAMN04488074_105139 [Lentzea albidocapillata subsp. violacea]|uniref:Helix-turn-helix domain-containing protein n=1 Tax=Lentzea albidocapillata subsp. violacea TaxID=128104 RepID=A0A1G9AYC6_9PSEU|nr:hypothetical protein [Lentzea albidocapillata]SDK31625.1 hypothetical protein SAMN04488074_105139 [Lentzea albidocapillata subsp. violacea]